MKKYILLFLLSYSTTLLSQHWEITEMAPMPERVSNSAVAAGSVNGTDYIYSFAGIDSTKMFSGIHLKGYRYNVQEDSWEIIPPLPDDMGKIAASADRVGDIIYIIGGYSVFSNYTEVSSDKVHRYDMASNTYLSDGAPIPVSIDDQVQAVWRDSLIYVITGWSDNGNVTDVQIYNPTEDTWMAGTSTPNNNDYKSFGSSGVIYNDTIYYFGGARSSFGFGIQNDFRKGIINAENPSEIEWSTTTLDNDIVGYRMAATISKGDLFWIGGSDKTYNFDGIAYAGNNVGVEPINRSLLFHPESELYDIDESNELPMDLRALGSVNDTVKYVVGGMLENQMVSNKVFRLERIGDFVNVATDELTREKLRLFPNPVQDVLYINLDDNQKEITFEILDALGRTVRNQKYITDGIDLSNLRTGHYWIKISEDANTILGSFYKK